MRGGNTVLAQGASLRAAITPAPRARERSSGPDPGAAKLRSAGHGRQHRATSESNRKSRGRSVRRRGPRWGRPRLGAPDPWMACTALQAVASEGSRRSPRSPTRLRAQGPSPASQTLAPRASTDAQRSTSGCTGACPPRPPGLCRNFDLPACPPVDTRDAPEHIVLPQPEHASADPELADTPAATQKKSSKA